LSIIQEGASSLRNAEMKGHGIGGKGRWIEDWLRDKKVQSLKHLICICIAALKARIPKACLFCSTCAQPAAR